MTKKTATTIWPLLFLCVCCTTTTAQNVEGEYQYLPFDQEYLSADSIDVYLEVQKGKVVELKERLKLVEQACYREREQLERSKQEVESIRKTISAVAAPRSFEDIGDDLAKRKTLVEIELVGAKAKQQALLEAAKSTKIIQDSISGKKLQLLRTVLSQKKENLSRMHKLVEKGLAGSEQIAKAKMEITKAEIELMEQEGVRALQSQGDSVTKSQLLAVSVDIAQFSAQLSLIEKKLRTWSDNYPLYAKVTEYVEKKIPLQTERAHSLAEEKAAIELEIAVESMKLKRKLKEYDLLKTKNKAEKENKVKPPEKGKPDKADKAGD